MTEEQASTTPQPNDEPTAESAPTPQPLHEHVRTDGETAVDDAWGTADDPS
jgi:hypothetical protein